MKQRLAEVLVDEPIAAGFSVLELSNARMYVLHYETVLREWPTAPLLYTDSLVYQVYGVALQDVRVPHFG